MPLVAGRRRASAGRGGLVARRGLPIESEEPVSSSSAKGRSSGPYCHPQEPRHARGPRAARRQHAPRRRARVRGPHLGHHAGIAAGSGVGGRREDRRRRRAAPPQAQARAAQSPHALSRSRARLHRGDRVGHLAPDRSRSCRVPTSADDLQGGTGRARDPLRSQRAAPEPHRLGLLRAAPGELEPARDGWCSRRISVECPLSARAQSGPRAHDRALAERDALRVHPREPGAAPHDRGAARGDERRAAHGPPGRHRRARAVPRPAGAHDRDPRARRAEAQDAARAGAAGAAPGRPLPPHPGHAGAPRRDDQRRA